MVACDKCGKYVAKHVKRKFVCAECLFYKNSFHPLSDKLKTESPCQICGDTKNLHVHHKDRNKHNDSLDNLLVVCSQCHSSIHAHGLVMPKGIKWGKCGKRLVYNNNEYKKPIIQKDARWGHVFIQKNNYLISK